MENEFIIPLSFGGKEMELPAKLLQYGYVVKIEVGLEGTTILFEPDEERNWRAVISWDDLQANKKVNRDLLLAVADAINIHTK